MITHATVHHLLRAEVILSPGVASGGCITRIVGQLLLSLPVASLGSNIITKETLFMKLNSFHMKYILGRIACTACCHIFIHSFNTHKAARESSTV